MRATLDRARVSHRRGDRGAVLVVVLLVMMTLLGMGLVGLYLTTGGIQMNANINMRNQALFVAEAGINRAKSVLNRTIPGLPTWSPNLSGMLRGQTSPLGAPVVLNVADEVPANPANCLAADGTARGAYLRDEPGTVVGCASNSAYVDCTVSYSNNLADPTAPPPPPTPSMGTYTLFIRQDLAECRVGNFTCDGDPNNPDPLCPTANGIVVLRSEGTASDNRTRVVLEVTMARNPNAPVVNSKLATVCPAGQAGCDDNASVQQGITVSGALTPPTAGTSGSSEAGGASGSGGSAGAGGETGGAAGASSTTPLAGNTASSSSTVGGAGGSNSSSSVHCKPGEVSCAGACCDGTCVSNTCCPKASHCNNIAVIGEYGIWGDSGQFNQWLSTHSSTCSNVATLDFEGGANWTSNLNNYGMLFVLDLWHTKAEIASFRATGNYWLYTGNDPAGGKQRIISDAEVTIVKNWVKSGRGLMTTAGVGDVARELTNPNKLLAPFNIQYDVTKPKWFLAGTGTPPNRINCWIHGGLNTCYWKWVTAPLNMSNVANLQVDSGWALMTTGPGPVTFAEPLGYISYYSWGKAGLALDDNTHVLGSPAGGGRVVAWNDEWLTYNHDWTPTTECPATANPGTPYWKTTLNSCTQNFWNNIVTWLRATCN